MSAQPQQPQDNMLELLYEVAKDTFSTEFKSEQERKNHFLFNLTQEVGGEYFYFPKGLNSTTEIGQQIITARNALIKSEFNGKNHRELSKKYRLSQVTIYKILRTKNEE